MPFPLALSLAALAGSAYASARLSLDADWLWLNVLGHALLNIVKRERNDRLNFFYVFEDHALHKATANRPCLLVDDKSYTYAEVYDLALRYGNWLKTRHGVKEKDIVPMDFRNVETFIFLWFGLWAIGAKPSFINYNLSGKPLSHCIKAVSSPLALIDPGVVDNFTDDVRDDLNGVELVVLTPEIEAEIRQTDPVRYPDSVRSDNKASNMAILIYTSGTTGLPKPAIVSWAKVHGGRYMSSLGTNTTRNDVFYTCMPLYHSSASLLGVCNTVGCGAAAAIGSKFSSKTFWRDVRKHNATIIQYVGEICRYLTVAPPEFDPATGECLDRKHSVRVACGNGLRPDVWNKFKDRFGIPIIFEFYAATEGASGMWNMSRNDFSWGAIGRYGIISGLYVGAYSAIVQLDFETEMPWRDPSTGFCKRVPTGESGELMFKLPEQDITSAFQGYFGNKKATSSKILRDVFVKGDAWFRTGDVARWDAQWHLFFMDRIGDTFRWKSENVSTAEVSQMLGLHPAVREANVYGVELPHHDGRAGCVAIVLDTREPKPELLRSLANHAKDSLPKYAVPLFLRVEKDVGMQNTGTYKQQKTVLRQQGVAPGNMEGDQIFWLKDGTYEPFTEVEWKALQQGAIKL